jgi:elongation factor P--beta-lysine ligase
MNIRNPADGSIGTCDEEAWSAFWRHKGWEQVTDDEVTVLTLIDQYVEGPSRSLDDYSKDELASAAERAGIEVKARDSKDKILDRLRTVAEPTLAGEAATETEEV